LAVLVDSYANKNPSLCVLALGEEIEATDLHLPQKTIE